MRRLSQLNIVFCVNLMSCLKEKKIDFNKIAFWGIFGILLFIPLLHISVRSLPYIYNDEFGYWASAAHFVGLDWSEVISCIPYYSYGYGVILTLIIRMTGDLAKAYKVAVALNGVWLALSFVFLYKAGGKIYPDIKKSIVLISAAIATAFSGNFVEVNYTWPEVFLFFLFCFLFYLIVEIVKRPSAFKMSVLSVCTVYSYSVHQRTLGIILATILLILVLVRHRKVNCKQLLFFALPFVLCFMATMVVKAEIIEEVWLNSNRVSGNNFSGQAEKIALLFSLEGIRDIILSFAGKLYYVFMATFLLVPFAIYIVFSKWWLQKNKTRKDMSKIFIGIFLVLSFVATIGINSLAMIKPGNITHIVYGRYTDNIFGPFLMIAIVEFARCKVNFKEVIIGIAVCAGLSGIVDYELELYNLQIQAAINNAGIAYLVENDCIELVKGFVIVIAVWIFLQMLNRIIKEREVMVGVISLFLVVLFFVIGQKTYEKFELDWSDAAESSEKHAQIIKDICAANGSVEIYAINSGPANFPWLFSGNGIQFLLYDKQVHSIVLADTIEMNWTDEAIVLAPCVIGEVNGLVEISNDTVYRLFVSDNIAQQMIK